VEQGGTFKSERDGGEVGQREHLKLSLYSSSS
jgi:hypothetical protein